MSLLTSLLNNPTAGALNYQGTWNASTNTPALVSSVGTKGFYYYVSVSGSTNLNGITDWTAGDYVTFNGTAWQKIDSTDSVASVFGRVGAVVAASGDYTAEQITNTPAGGVAATTVQTAINELDTEKEAAANKDASGGYAGLTLFKINFKNAANTFISFFTNSNTAARTYTFQDRNGTIADDTDLAIKAPLASPTFTGTATSPTFVATGAAITQNNFTANSGSSYTIDPANGASQQITLNASTPTLTLGTAPTENQFLQVELIQDGTGSRLPTWANVTWATTGGIAPSINSAIGASTYFTFYGRASGWIGMAANQNLGITDGSSAAAGYIGEVITSTLAIGSATSLTTATAKTITSITLTPGDWMVSGNIGFIAAAGTIPTALTASISATDNTQATSPNDGGFSQIQATLGTASTNILALSPTRINITTTTTYYLVGTATFTISTLTGYGSITARRFR